MKSVLEVITDRFGEAAAICEIETEPLRGGQSNCGLFLHTVKYVGGGHRSSRRVLEKISVSEREAEFYGSYWAQLQAKSPGITPDLYDACRLDGVRFRFVIEYIQGRGYSLSELSLAEDLGLAVAKLGGLHLPAEHSDVSLLKETAIVEFQEAAAKLLPPTVDDERLMQWLLETVPFLERAISDLVVVFAHNDLTWGNIIVADNNWFGSCGSVVMLDFDRFGRNVSGADLQGFLDDAGKPGSADFFEAVLVSYVKALRASGKKISAAEARFGALYYGLLLRMRWMSFFAKREGQAQFAVKYRERALSILAQLRSHWLSQEFGCGTGVAARYRSSTIALR